MCSKPNKNRYYHHQEYFKMCFFYNEKSFIIPIIVSEPKMCAETIKICNFFLHFSDHLTRCNDGLNFRFLEVKHFYLLSAFDLPHSPIDISQYTRFNISIALLRVKGTLKERKKNIFWLCVL